MNPDIAGDRPAPLRARPARGYTVTCVVLGAVTGLTVLAQASLLASGTATVVAGGGLPASTIAALVATVLARAALAWAQGSAGARAAARIRSRLRHDLYTHLVRLGPGWLTGERRAEVTALATSGLDSVDGLVAGYLPQVVPAVLVPVLALVVVTPADWVAGLTIGVTAPLIPLLMLLVGRTVRDRAGHRPGALERLAYHFTDAVAGATTVKAYRRERAQIRSIRRASDAYRRAAMRGLRLAYLSGLAAEVLAAVSVALIAVGVALRVAGGTMDLRTGLLVLLLAPEAYLPLRRLVAAYPDAAAGVAAVQRVGAILATPPALTGDRTDIPRRVPLFITDLSVSFGGRPVIEEFSLEIAPGETVAITGPNGVGKSALLAAVLGFVPSGSGRVRLGDLDIVDADPAAWRAGIAWMPQRPLLRAGTVVDNIRLGRPDATYGEVVAAARAAGMGAGVMRRSIEESIPAEGRQRIALARAFLRDAPVVLLDEPTAGLDGAAEAAVLPVIGDLLEGRTGLVVSHRPAVLALAGRVAELAPAWLGVAR